MRPRLPLMIPLVLVAADEARLVSVPGAPECATFAVEHGNPKAEGSVTLVKLASGCTVPMCTGTQRMNN